MSTYSNKATNFRRKPARWVERHGGLLASLALVTLGAASPSSASDEQDGRLVGAVVVGSSPDKSSKVNHGQRHEGPSADILLPRKGFRSSKFHSGRPWRYHPKRSWKYQPKRFRKYHAKRSWKHHSKRSWKYHAKRSWKYHAKSRRSHRNRSRYSRS